MRWLQGGTLRQSPPPPTLPLLARSPEALTAAPKLRVRKSHTAVRRMRLETSEAGSAATAAGTITLLGVGAWERAAVWRSRHGGQEDGQEAGKKGRHRAVRRPPTHTHYLQRLGLAKGSACTQSTHSA